MKWPRVLLIAEAANPEQASVPLVGWSHYDALRRVADVHLVTQIRNRDALQRRGLMAGVQFTAIDSEAVAATMAQVGLWLRGSEQHGWTTATALKTIAYYYFEHLVWRTCARRLADGEFDLVHRVTPLSPVTPSMMAQKCKQIGVPFVLGPLNGGLRWPKQFGELRRREREWLAGWRRLHTLLPAHASTRNAASAILIGSKAALDSIHARLWEKCVYLPENAVESERVRKEVPAECNNPLQVVFAGRLVPVKGVDMLLEAAAPLITSGSLRLTIIGDGPERVPLEALGRKRQLGSQLAFRGWRAREVYEALGESDIFAFPSVKDFGGGAVLEAMAVGLAPIVIGYGGPAELVTPETGYIVPLGDRTAVIAGLRRSLAEAIEKPQSLLARRRAALDRARALFTWDVKAQQVLDVYRWVLGELTSKPSFGFFGSRSDDLMYASVDVAGRDAAGSNWRQGRASSKEARGVCASRGRDSTASSRGR